ncbi:hypothetical protein SAMN05421630_11279 [Prauserella marina]|uniref:Uncharacterized protein n=1 Tax=Prauserella marina TaxID=530584 RepID=A0A1G6XGI7_9PSEU|nr:hypothetical protein [Prauserella marina]PWV72560.1 hypothetical protein DES30_110159 [Prauserella marina]SDD77171.1 hypothetical protein SAMN05421630_11279 [Prauserella marina]
MANGYQGPPQPPPGQGGGPYPGGGYQHRPPYPPTPPEPPRPNRKRKLTAIVVTVVLVVAAGVTGVLLLTGGEGDRPELAARPGAQETAFPDIASFDYDAGEDAVCEALLTPMSSRGYELRSSSSEYGVTCTFGTPTTSALEDGVTDLHASVFLIRGDAERAYAMKLGSTERFMRDYANDSASEIGELQGVPIGDEGYFQSTEFPETGNTRATAAFLSGNEMVGIDLGGHLVALGRDAVSEPLTDDVLYDEMIDIVKTLNGDGTAGEARISPSKAEEYPDLPELGDPELPSDGTGEARCAPVTGVAEQFGMATKKTDAVGGQVPVTLCEYGIPAEDRHETRAGGNLHVSVSDYTGVENLPASTELTRRLRFIIENVVNESAPDNHQKLTLGPIYTLPAGQSGYMVYTRSDAKKYGSGSTGTLEAAYLVGEVYYEIRLHGATYPGELTTPEARSEDELIGDLMTVLTSMDS